MNNIITQAAEKLSKCKMILIGAGAGMGKDSGLPDFRGNDGFWNNYPPYRNKFNFYQCANPQFLNKHPHLFWGFYGSRLIMYRNTKPHKGFDLLKQISQKIKYKFIVTSNVDGHFQQVFPQNMINQVHGSINYLQCSSCLTLTQNKFQPIIDYNEMSCKNLPKCTKCNNYLRPNILMFGDWDWISDRNDIQHKQYNKFLKDVKKEQQNGQKLAIIQIGCGTAVPTIRNMCQNVYYHNKYSIYIRINPDENQKQQKYNNMNEQRFFVIKKGALEAIQQLYNQIVSKNF